MTAWLPISTYPYDGTWGLFRGVEKTHLNKGRDGLCWRQGQSEKVYLAKSAGEARFGPCSFDVEAGCVWIENPTEWLPLSILDMLEEHHVTAARIVL